MPDIAHDFLIRFWPLLVGITVFLIHWNIRFFRMYKKEKDKEFQKFMESCGTYARDQFEIKFQSLAKETKDAWETAQRVVDGCHGAFERRVSRLEGSIPIKGPDK